MHSGHGHNAAFKLQTLDVHMTETFKLMASVSGLLDVIDNSDYGFDLSQALAQLVQNGSG